MKSLEIVNESIEYIEFTLKYDGDMDYKQKELVKDSLKKTHQIKRDLEVLDIIKNKRVDVSHLKNSLHIGETNEEALEIYNVYLDDEMKLTMEELLKLKQWLEVSE